MVTFCQTVLQALLHNYLHHYLLSIIDSCCHKKLSWLLRGMNDHELVGAALHGNVNKVRFLIERGADVNSSDEDGKTALDLACLLRHTTIASLLIKGGADINIRDNRGDTILDLACLLRGTAIVSLLIERGADVDSRDKHGWTALYLACQLGHKETAILLIMGKADIYIQNNDGSTPLDFQPEWREELTQLYEVTKTWLARNAFLYVLIGCNHIESESNKHNVSKQTQSERESEETSDELRALRDNVLRNVNLSIFSFL